MERQIIKAKGKVFRDPVHRLIRIDPSDQFILDLINTPEFQRLRRVRQLGVSSLTYHGAEHSRFVHSMGVFNFAQRILEALRRRYSREAVVLEIIERHAKPLKAAALLHDIGHGPFSHMIERAFSDGFDHESMTMRLVTDDNSMVGRVLAEHGIERAAVAEIIGKTYVPKFIVDVVSSQLDADRMDYLLRDSLCTGVEYGRYDPEWLLNSLCIGADPSSTHAPDDPNSWRLCLDRERGLYAAEQLILARAHMTMQVYMHRVTRGYEVLLLNLFQLAAALESSGDLPSGTPEVVRTYFRLKGDLPYKDWFWFDEAALVTAMHVWARAEGSKVTDLARLAAAFLNRERIYEGRSIGNLGPVQQFELSRQLEASGLKRGMDWELDNGELLPYKGVLYSASKPKGDPEEQSAESILLASGEIGQRGQAIETVSEIMKQLDFKRQAVPRVYFNREKISLLPSTLKGSK